MKRIEKIYSYIQEKAVEYTKNNDLSKKGIDAIEISENLKILRNNVSKELNELCRMGKLVKVKSRPVKYFDKKRLEIILEADIKNVISIEDFKKSISDILSDTEKCPFDYLIGFKTSLKNQIEQAKAALMYEPNRLHVLLLGESGVGKSLFANKMYQYGKYINKFDKKAPFINFNCGEYGDNTQLLLVKLFGYMEGFAIEDNVEKIGAIEKADGGILFLDEIHNLPIEGQEMIFQFINTGEFNRLGKNESKRKVKVLIVGSTTEDHDSISVKTFMKRIPITICIPTFEERVIRDRVDIIKELFQFEAIKVNKPIKVTREIIKALMGSVKFGNIGQLKSNIQLVCARAFLNNIDDKKEIDVNWSVLSQNIKFGLINIENQKLVGEEIAKLVEEEIIIYPYKKQFKIIEDNYEPPFNLYKIIEDKFIVLRNEGMRKKDINKFINTDIDIHIKYFYESLKSKKFSKNKLCGVIDKEIIDFAEEVRIYLNKELKKEYGERFLYDFSLHLSSLFTRMNQQTEIQEKYFNMGERIVISSREYKLSKYISDMIERRFNIIVSENESAYIMALIVSIEENNNGKVGIIVVAHGNSTSSSMVNVAVKIFENKNILSIDIPLNISPEDTLKIVCEKIKEIDSGKGVLLLFDMGALSSFESEIYEKIGARVKLIDMVSTPTVLEAARKTSLDNLTLDEIYNYIKYFKGYNNIIAAVSNPNESVPFISLEKFRYGNSEKMLNSILSGENNSIDIEKDNVAIEKLCYDILKKTIMYFNPDKIIGLLLEFMDNLERESQKKYSNSNKVRVMIYVACALERVVLRDELEYHKKKDGIDERIVDNVRKALKIFENRLNLKMSNDEIYYIVDSLN